MEFLGFRKKPASKKIGWSLQNIVLVLGVIGGLTAFAINQYQRYSDEAAKLPQLQYVSKNDGANPIVITLKNDSTEQPTAITKMTYFITDPEVLKQIETRHPKPISPKGAATTGEVANPIDSGNFVHGAWVRGGYNFVASLALHIPHNGVQDISIAVDRGRWSGIQFVGDLTIHSDAADRSIPNVKIAVATGGK
ncbi:MAG: hypothetical protein C0483_10365 [Pirellula sp.]|nr:hypothetical protein [Pirellula sp.]